MPASFTTVLEIVWEQITKCMETIAGNAILMIPVVISFVGAIIEDSYRFVF